MFFFKASAEGTAVAENVLAGTTFSNDNDTGLTGTMTNNGTLNYTLPINGSYTIPQGYHNGSGKVIQSIATKGAQIYTPTTSDQTISAGQYLSEAQTIKGDGNLVPSNILNNVSIFGVTGNVTIENLGGKKIDSNSFSLENATTYTVTLGYRPNILNINIATAGGGIRGYCTINPYFSYSRTIDASGNKINSDYFIVGNASSLSTLNSGITVNIIDTGFTVKYNYGTYRTINVNWYTNK